MGNMQLIMDFIAITALASINVVSASQPQVIQRQAKDTLTAVELDKGETIEFRLMNGQTRLITLEETSAVVLLTNIEQPKKGFHGGGTVYMITARMRMDGHPILMSRYVPIQQSFYEPLVVNGMRIWFDAVRELGDLFNENHGDCLPDKQARFAMQDATLPVSPQELRPWYPNDKNYIDVHDCYNGDDTWIGPYCGADLHGGLDVNTPNGTPLWSPIDFDDQFYFNSIEMGHNNNRWRGIREWPNGDIWALQAHHINQLLVDENAPISQGTQYAVAAGELLGSHAHTHFVFRTNTEGKEYLLDPWILFWQIFENNKDRSREIKAVIAPLSPAKTGKAVNFDSSGSRPGITGVGLRYYWTFGDGGWSNQRDPEYTYIEPGIYPVTLVVSDGTELDTFTQHITVDGEPVDEPALVLSANDEITFRHRPIGTLDIYGQPVRFIPHTLEFTAMPNSRKTTSPKKILLKNTGSGILSDAHIEIEYLEDRDWLEVSKTGDGNRQEFSVIANASKIKPKEGIFSAIVSVDCPGVLNSPQLFRVQLITPERLPAKGASVVIDDQDPGCYATPWFWFSPRFHNKWPDGFREIYLTNGSRPNDGEFVRFAPLLRGGRYEVSISERTPVRPSETDKTEIRYAVRVKHKNGTDIVWVEPLDSLIIGTFDFHEGTDGYIEIMAGDSMGPIVADAVIFKPVE